LNSETECEAKAQRSVEKLYTSVWRLRERTGKWLECNDTSYISGTDTDGMYYAKKLFKHAVSW